MKRFKMAGVDQDSGAEVLIFIDTTDDQTARTFASKKRITLAGLWPVEDQDAVATNPPATERLAGGILTLVKWGLVLLVCVVACWAIYSMSLQLNPTGR